MTSKISDTPCPLLIWNESGIPKLEELRTQLESKDDDVKAEALRQVIFGIMNGENFSKLLMSVIKYCLHSENHTIKRLLLFFWEVVDKKKSDGHLLPEMILVCNAMKNNLQHPNEYIRGATLRFLCNIKEIEILESLIPSITANLEHRHSYVRKNAVLTVYTIYEVHPDLIPDAPDQVEKYMAQETNASCKRNAFLMLSACAQDRAVAYLNSVLDQLSTTGESFQLAALELIRKVCRANPMIKSQYVRCIYGLTNSTSNAVAFEAANTLISLSSARTAVRAAVSAYTRLLSAESDNNVKLIILNRLIALKKKHEKVLQELLMDILRVLASPNIDIRKKTLELTLDLVSKTNVDEVINVLKKEMLKTDVQDSTVKHDDYRKLLVDALHKCAIKFPDVVSTVVQLLMNYVGDENPASALDVIYFVREIVEEYPALRDTVLTKLMENFDQIRWSHVYRVALWVVGEYCTEAGVLDFAFQTIRSAVGELPLVPPLTASQQEEKRKADEEKAKADAAAAGPVKKDVKSSRPVVLADGTYAQQSAVIEKADVKTAAAIINQTTVRSLLLSGDYFLATSLANCMTKLLLRFCTVFGYGTPESNAEIAKGLQLFVSILRYGTSKNTPKPIDKDSQQRISLCMRTLLEPKATSDIFLIRSRECFHEMIAEQRTKTAAAAKPAAEVVRQADDVISIRQLKGQQPSADMADDEDLLDSDITKAVHVQVKEDDFSSKLNRVFQLTGFSDPVYAEATLTILEYNIVLDVLLVNQTKNVLQNLQVELLTSRDLKVVDRLPTLNVAPLDFVKFKANIKVSSTESGVIFGNIVYDSQSGTQKTVVVLNSIHMDIVDYISPGTCLPMEFRNMWAEFEWENKVAVNTDISDLNDYLDHIVKITNMKCLTPEAALSGSCVFLAANLYARSIFGEDALLNLSIEKVSTGKISGYIRIRSKAQGIALSLGDKITNKQRSSGKTQAGA